MKRDEAAIVIRRGHVRASHMSATAGIQIEMKEV
jgi:hypothetical protein